MSDARLPPTQIPPAEHSPLKSLDEWEDFVVSRYPQDGAADQDAVAEKLAHHKSKEEFRNYKEPPRDTVREFYRLNHTHQTFDFVRAREKEFLALDKKEMSCWEAIEFLNTLVDDSDPDTSMTQLEHLLQTAEAIRGDGHPDWFVLAGLVHDLGKILCLWGEPQWAVVGDTFPVGCAYSDRIVFPEFFAHNPDTNVPEYQTPCGVYREGCGLRNVHMSWGHDEYIARVLRDHLPEPALYMLRYHSFYPAHREGAYGHLMDDHDREMFRWVKAFNPYDLYSKSPVPPDVQAIKPYYEKLVAKYLPAKLRW
jgi:inositol oxygenase